MRSDVSLAKFYDRFSYYVLFTNFLKSGDRFASFTMHKTLQIPKEKLSVYTRSSKPNYINDLVLDVLGLNANSPNVLDVGCGFGGTIFRWYDRMGGQFTGVNLSKVQVDIANNEAKRRGIENHCQFLCRSFNEPLPAKYDIVVAIESLNYSPALTKTVMNLVNSLKPGGKLIIVDDIIAGNGEEKSNNISVLKKHWHLGSLPSKKTYQRLFKENNLTIIYEKDLSSQFTPMNFLVLWLIVKVCAVLFLVSPFDFIRTILSAYIGSVALQRLYHEGLVKYIMIVGEKVSP